jgi:hypothetical protein
MLSNSYPLSHDHAAHILSLSQTHIGECPIIVPPLVDISDTAAQTLLIHASLLSPMAAGMTSG